jgi:subtilisin family serine protease
LTSSRSGWANDWFFNLETYVHNRIEKPTKYLPDTLPVKIAVLDTGIDLDHPFIKAAMRLKRIKETKSFVDNDETMKDESGHGTHVTALLLRVAPEAKIYIAKVAKDEEIPSDHRITNVSIS